MAEITGLDQGKISKYERALIEPSPTTVATLCEAMNADFPIICKHYIKEKK